MRRVTVNLETEVGDALEAKAAIERRTVSGYVGLLIENDLRSAEIETRDALLNAAAEVGLDDALAAVRRLARRRKGEAA